MIHSCRQFAVATILLAVFSAGTVSAQNADALFEEALELHASLTSEGNDVQRLREIRALLDRIIDEHPASDLAFRILLQDTVNGLDVAAIDRWLSDLPPGVAKGPGEVSTDPIADTSTAESLPTPTSVENALQETNETSAVLDEAEDGAALTTNDAQSILSDPEPEAVPGADVPSQAPEDILVEVDSLAGLLVQAQALNEAALEGSMSERPNRMTEVQAVIERIINEYPTSDEAISLLLGLSVGSIDPAQVRQLAAQVQDYTSDAPPGAEASQQGSSGSEPVGETLSALDLFNSCYRSITDLSGPDVSEQEITVVAQIGIDGELVGIPALIAPAAPDSTARRLFQSLLSALDACAPSSPAQLPNGFGSAAMPFVNHAGEQMRIAFRTGGAVSIRQETASPTIGTSAVAEPQLQVEAPISPNAQTREWRAASEADQARLNLNRVQIRELQGRLTAIGLDPRGVDGSIGRGTRSAIAEWQKQNGIPETGFLDDLQWTELSGQSQERFVTWVRSNPTLAPDAQPSRATTTRRTARYFDSRGCLREPNGRIVRNFRSDCR